MEAAPDEAGRGGGRTPAAAGGASREMGVPVHERDGPSHRSGGLFLSHTTGSSSSSGGGGGGGSSGFTFWVGVAFTVNYIMGTGFLALPYAFAGMVSSPAVFGRLLVRVCVLKT